MKKTMKDINQEKEMQETQGREPQAYAFYSKVLSKVFDTVEELEVAEAEHAAELKAKEDAAALKKAEANKVEEAFKARNAAVVEYNTKIMAARKEYNDALAAASEAFSLSVAEATKAKEAAESDYSAALKEFTEKHPEGYHMTLKDGDNVMTISSQGDNVAKTVKEYNSLIEYLMNNLWKNF
jgi:hypothetical protein